MALKIRIASRRSDLARLQSYRVAEALQKKNSDLTVEFEFKESLGDKNLTDPLWKMPEKGVFTEDFVQDLANGTIDMVVHSWKDLPTEPRVGSEIYATLPRADQRDLLFVKKASIKKIIKLRRMQVFSSSPRREFNLKPFLLNHLPFDLEGLEFLPVRGNIQTRLRKLLENPEVSGLVLAKAAWDRLVSSHEKDLSETKDFLLNSLPQLHWCVLPLSQNPTAAAQGALAIEILSSREDLKKLLEPINCQQTFRNVQREREILSAHGGGCHQKIGISVVSHRHGCICSLRGQTQLGKSLLEWSLKSKETLPPKMPEASLWSQPKNRNKSASILLSESLSVPELESLQVSGLFVASSRAWPPTWSPRFDQKQISEQDSVQDSVPAIWTSGLETWKALAKMGIWVNGTQDSLGENYPMNCFHLAPSQKWIKLTHQSAEKILADHGHRDSEAEGAANIHQSGNPEVIFESLATYALPQELQVPGAQTVAQAEFFYWSSASQFLDAIERAPMLIKKLHATGPGHTYEVVLSHVNDKKRVFAFLSEADWRKQCTL